MDVRLLLFALVVVLVAAAGATLHVRKRTRLRRARGALFRDVTALFTDVTVTQDDIDFPVLTGSRAGFRWRLEPVVDSLTYRKLPVLWLCVTCYADLDVTAPVSVLLRPAGNEFFSPNAKYACELPLPEGCPTHARAASTSPCVEVALGPARELLADPVTKEVVLSRRGMRVVSRVGEAESGPYRVGRRIDLGTPVLTAAHVVTRCDAIAASVRGRQAVAS